MAEELEPIEGETLPLLPEIPGPEWFRKLTQKSQSKRHTSAIVKHGTVTRVSHPDLFLPDFGEQWRYLPNEIARSGLFSVRNRREPRELRHDYPIVVIGDGEIRYRGEELRQDDALVWMQLVHLARTGPVGSPVKFPPYAFCKAIGWSPGGREYEHLRECLSRMQATSVSIRSKRLRRGIHTSMIPKFQCQDPESGAFLPHYQVLLSNEFLELFMETYVTRLEWVHVKDLPKGIAGWLYGLTYATKDPDKYAPSLDTLAEAAMSKATPKKWREQIIRSCRVLETRGLIAGWAIEGGRLYISRFKSRKDHPLTIISD